MSACCRLLAHLDLRRLAQTYLHFASIELHRTGDFDVLSAIQFDGLAVAKLGDVFRWQTTVSSLSAKFRNRMPLLDCPVRAIRPTTVASWPTCLRSAAMFVARMLWAGGLGRLPGEDRRQPSRARRPLTANSTKTRRLHMTRSLARPRSATLLCPSILLINRLGVQDLGMRIFRHTQTSRRDLRCIAWGREQAWTVLEGRPMTRVSDRNLLLGMLALRLGFVDRDVVADRTEGCGRHTAVPLWRRIWSSTACWETTEQTVLDLAVDRYLAKHGDLAGSAAALETSISFDQLVRDLAASDVGLDMADAADAFRTRVATAERPAWEVGSSPGSAARFQSLRPHASGGLGEVFIARDKELNRDVALKEIHARYADNEEIRARFLLEAEITGGLEHPGIVPVYGKGQDATGRPFYAMRFIRGRSLRDAIRQLHDQQGKADAPGGWRLGLRRLLSAFIDVCNAVAYAHSRGILHRDLKPENVMLGRYGETLLVDWGLAKLMGQAEPYQPRDAEADMSIVSLLRPEAASGSTPTRYGAVVGTPTYMSPEQAAGLVDRLGTTSDVYSLGATLYVLDHWAGSVRGEVGGGRTVGGDRRSFPAAAPGERPGTASLWKAICLKAMRLDPEQRYQTAEELAADIEKWMADEPVSAWKEPVSVQAVRWMRRHRTSVAGVLSAILVAVVSLSVTVALLAAANERERSAKEAAVTNEQQARTQPGPRGGTGTTRPAEFCDGARRRRFVPHTSQRRCRPEIAQSRELATQTAGNGPRVLRAVHSTGAPRAGAAGRLGRRLHASGHDHRRNRLEDGCHNAGRTGTQCL